MCPMSRSRWGAPPKNLIKLQLELCSKCSTTSSDIYIATVTETKPGVFSRQISLNSPSRNKYLRFGAEILRAKLSKYDNDKHSRRGQLETRLWIASQVIETWWRLRIFKCKNPLKVGGGCNSHRTNSKRVNFWQENRQEGTVNHSHSPNSRRISLTSFLERKRIHWSISGQIRKLEVVIWNLWIGPAWRRRTWVINFLSLSLRRNRSSSNTRSVIPDHLYLHLLDNILVLTASLIGNRTRMLSIMLKGRLLIKSSFGASSIRNFQQKGLQSNEKTIHHPLYNARK